MTIKTRLTFLFTLIVASILAFFCLAIYVSNIQYREKEFNERLREKAITTAKLLLEVNEITAPLLKTIDKNNLTSLHKEEVTILDNSFNLVYDSGNDQIKVSREVLIKIRDGQEMRFKEGQREAIGLRYEDFTGRHIIIASAEDLYGFSKIKYLALIMITGWCLSIIIVMIAGYIFADRALAPMSEVIKQVDTLTFDSLDKRVNTNNEKDEIGKLASTFNNMLVRLEEAAEVNKSFVRHASHELRTPLTVLTGQIEVALLQDRSPAYYQQLLSDLLTDILKMNRLANGLLDLTYASAKASNLKVEAIRVDEMLWQVRSDLLKKQPNYHINILFLPMEDLEEEELTILGNANLIYAALFNLAENACKYSEDQTVNIDIEYTGNAIKLDFIDQGIGISDSDIDHIFEPFYRAENAKTVTGHGIGLSLTQKIIKQHAGTLSIKTALGNGSTFTIALPIKTSRLAL